MSPCRPIGHIAGNLQILAIHAAYRLRQAIAGSTYCCWVDDDGCVYLALSSHPRAKAVMAHAADQLVNQYRRPLSAPFPLSALDIHNDLQEARVSQASRHLGQAHAEALPA